jgi:hypothetical protein
MKSAIGRGRILAVAGVILVILPSLVSGCGGGGTGAKPLDVEVASYELVANQDNRFIAGLLAQDQEFVSYGTVKMSFSYLGAGEGEQSPQFFTSAQATFLPLPGSGPATPPPATIIGPPTSGQGVYAAEPVRFDRSGFWQVEVTADVSGRTYSGESAFQVLDAPRVPAVGDKAIASDNFVLDSNVPAQAIDSRASSPADIPDAPLHELTIAQALQQHKPLVIVFSTPVYCISRFCGPITDMIADLQKQFGDQANFIHVEIWQDFQKHQPGPTALQWLYRGGDLREPWVFLVDRSGTIVGRWDNVVTRDEVLPALQKAIDAPS